MKKEIKIKVAECDICNGKRATSMYKCPGCGKHICYSCRDKSRSKTLELKIGYASDNLELNICNECYKNPPTIELAKIITQFEKGMKHYESMKKIKKKIENMPSWEEISKDNYEIIEDF